MRAHFFVLVFGLIQFLLLPAAFAQYPHLVLTRLSSKNVTDLTALIRVIGTPTAFTFTFSVKNNKTNAIYQSPTLTISAQQAQAGKNYYAGSRQKLGLNDCALGDLADLQVTLAPQGGTTSTYAVGLPCSHCVAPATIDTVAYSTCDCPNSQTQAYNPNTDKCENRPQGYDCSCDPGYWYTSDPRKCSRDIYVAPLKPLDPTPVVKGDWSDFFYLWEKNTVSTLGDTNWPFNNNNAYNIYDSKGVKQSQQLLDTPYWKDYLNTRHPMSIKYAGSVTGVWYSKQVCVKAPVTGTYVFLAGGDNDILIRQDGKDFYVVTDGGAFSRGFFMDFNLASGSHTFELRYYNENAEAAVWMEIYHNTLAQIRSAAKDADLVRTFTTASLIGTQNWNNTGEACPVTYIYDACNTKMSATPCKKTLLTTCQYY